MRLTGDVVRPDVGRGDGDPKFHFLTPYPLMPIALLVNGCACRKPGPLGFIRHLPGVTNRCPFAKDDFPRLGSGASPCTVDGQVLVAALQALGRSSEANDCLCSLRPMEADWFGKHLLEIADATEGRTSDGDDRPHADGAESTPGDAAAPKTGLTDTRTQVAVAVVRSIGQWYRKAALLNSPVEAIF